MAKDCKHENLKFVRFGCALVPGLGASRILWECVDCGEILSREINPAPNKSVHADAWDSAASTGSSNAENESASDSDTTPTQRG